MSTGSHGFSMEADWRRVSLESLSEDNVAALIRRDNEGSLGLDLKVICKYAAQGRRLACLRWAYMRSDVSKNEILPLTTDWPEGRRWLLDH